MRPENVFIHLLKNEQRASGYLQVNPSGLIPTLVDGGEVITQSLAIIEYLDETHPLPPLLPASAAERARVRSIALAIACDIHPIDNLRVLKYLTGVLKISEQQKVEWYAHWVHEGLLALETQLAPQSCLKSPKPKMPLKPAALGPTSDLGQLAALPT